MFMLSVEVHKPRPQGSQEGKGRQRTVHGASSPAFAPDFPGKDQFPLPRIHPVGKVDGNVGKTGFDKGGVGPGTDHGRVGTVSQNGLEAIDNHRLARPRLPRQHCQSGVERKRQVVDNGEIPYGKVLQQGSPLFPLFPFPLPLRVAPHRFPQCSFVPRTS